MSKINVLSPYFINVSATGLESVSLQIYIYTGTQTTGSTIANPTYTLQSTAINDQVTFEISELVKDYFDITYNASSPVSEIIWIDYIITKTISGSTSSDAIARLKAFYGYGYFSDGANPVNNQALLQSNQYVLKLSNDPISIPVDTSIATQVNFYQNATLVDTETITSSTNSQNQIQYVSNNSGSADIDSAIIFHGSSTTTITIENISECVYTPLKITFINKLGAFQNVYFFKKSIESLETEKEKFKRNIISSGSYSIADHVDTTLVKNGKTKLSLNSGFYPESNNTLFEELILSEFAWIEFENQTLPIQITSSSMTYKTSVNDRMINYDIEVEFAFDKINNIR